MGIKHEDDGFVDMMDESTLRPGDCVPVGRLKLRPQARCADCVFESWSDTMILSHFKDCIVRMKENHRKNRPRH